MTATPAERTLDAEVRAVEEGHHARLSGDGRHFLVKSDTDPRATYRVGVAAVGETVVFTCDHLHVMGAADQASRSFIPCKHGALCARRLEREGLLRWDGGRWLPSEKAYTMGVADRPAEDPFEVLGQPGGGA